MKFKHLSSFPLAIFAASCAQTWAAEPVTIVFQNGLKHPANPEAFYQGTVDRQITKTGGSSLGTMSVDGGDAKWGDGSYTNVLVRFDEIETLIPQGAKVLEAKLTVVTGTGGNDQSGDIFQVYRLTREFDSSSSMATRDGVVGFGEDGVIGDSDWLVASFQPPNVTGAANVSTDITRAVQSWVDGSPNFGIGIIPNRGTNAWVFNSSAAAASPTLNPRPKLEVTYILGDDAKAVDYQQGLNGYAGAFDMILNRNNATSVTPGTNSLGRNLPDEKGLDGLNPPTAEPDIPGLFRFDGIEQSIVGRKIEKATLKFVTGGFGVLNASKDLVYKDNSASSSGPFTVHRLLVPFSEATQYGPSGDFNAESGKLVTAGKITPAIASYTGMANTEVVDADITEAVKAWAAGAPNYGLYIGASTPDAWAVYFSGATETARRPVLSIVSSEASPLTIASPVNASRHTIGTPFNFQATTASPATKVEFFVDGKTYQTDESNPFTVSYPADKYGNFTLRATMTRPDLATVSAEDVSFSVVPPAGAGGVYFNGTTDHVALGDPAALKLSTFTLETWFRRETKGTATDTGGVVAIPLIAKGRNQADVSQLDMNWFLGIRASDGVLCADLEGAGTVATAGAGVNVPVVGRTAVPFGQWQHAAATFDGTHWRLYLNGNLEAVVEAKVNGNMISPRADSVQHASIASALNSGGLPEGAFGGFIDEARVWGVARTQAQIRETINSELQSAEGLVARFGMTEGSGTTITSTVAPNLVGTFVDSPMWAAGQTYNGNINPTIRFLSPDEGLSITNTTPLTYTVEASDPDGTIAKVEYYDNGILVATVTNAPYSFTYATPPVAMRRMVAVVYDNAGGSSRTDNILSTFVNYNPPTVPGYSVGIIDGKDADLATNTPAETPAASPAPWSVVASTASPRAFTGIGTDSGDIPVNINGAAAAFNKGVVLATNASFDGNLAPIDNIVAPYNDDGVYHVSSRDNSGPADAHPTVAPESSSFSLGWFPFVQGWTGANIAADGTIVAGSSNLPATAKITRPTNDQGVVIAGTYQIYGLPTTGNVITIATGNDSDNVASVVRSGDNWIVTTRDNIQNLEDNDFAILYIPSTANRVLSGWVNQKSSTLTDFETTPLNDELTTLGFTVTSSARGYELTFGDGSAINPSNTALFVCADNTPGLSNNGGDNIYSYSASGNSFLIFSHDLPGLNRSAQVSGFRFLATPINPTVPGANEISISPIKDSAGEDDADATLKFRVARSGVTTGPLVVNYTVSGTATSGSDFTALTGSVTIPAGQSSTEIVVSLVKDAALEQNETLIITLANGAGYTPGSSTSAAAVIQDSKPVVPTTTLVFQEGSNGYTGQFQLQISDEGTTRLGSAVEVYGVDGGLPDVNDLMRFDNIIGNATGQIPPNAKILDASLTVTVGGSTNDTSPGPFLVDRLTVPVDATTTHDGISNGSSDGPLQGARRGSARTPVAGFPRLALNAVGSANVTNIVREWTSGIPNYGFSIYDGGTTDALSYGTVGNKTVSKRPKLTVTYTTVPVHEYTLVAERSALISYKPGVATQDGATLENHVGLIVSKANESQEAFLKFPFAFDGGPNAIPANEEIIKAELLIHTNVGGQTNTPVGIHQVLQDWDTTTSYGINGPLIGQQVAESAATFTGLGENSTTWVDVTSIIRNWRAGAPNFGFNFRPTGTDDWTFHFPGAAEGVAPRLRITTIGGDAPAGTPFDEWATSFGATGIALNSDNDHDGITALVEYALGLSPTAANVLPGVVRNGNEFSLSFAKGALAATDPRIAYRIVSSTDLGTWAPEASAVNNSSVVTLTQTIGAGKKFFRLEVVYNP